MGLSWSSRVINDPIDLYAEDKDEIPPQPNMVPAKLCEGLEFDDEVGSYLVYITKGKEELARSTFRGVLGDDDWSEVDLSAGKMVRVRCVGRNLYYLALDYQTIRDGWMRAIDRDARIMFH